MSASRNKLLEIARRRYQVSQLFLKGYNQTAIGHELGVSQATVCGDLKAIGTDWRASSIRDFDLARQKEVHRLEGLIQSASESFEQSKRPVHTARIRSESSGEAEKTIKNQNGDPKYLEIIRKCSGDLRTLLLLDRTADGPSPATVEQGRDHVLLETIAEELTIDELRTLNKTGERLATAESGHDKRVCGQTS